MFLAFIKEGLIKNKLEKHKWIIHYIETHLNALIWIHIFTKDYLLTLVFVNSNLSITHLDLRVIENYTHLKSILLNVF